MTRFTDRAAIVTGAASGLGAAVARRLAAESALVTCLDLDEAGAAATAASIADTGGRARAHACDVTDEASVADAVEAAASDHGRPTVLVNAAGVLRFSHSTETTLAEWNLVVGVNLTGTFLVCRATLPHLLDGGGTIVNIASTAGIRGHAYAAAYCASKGGVIQLTRELAEEYKARGVRVNAVAPGGMRTPMVANLEIPDGAEMRLLLKHTSPLGEAEPDEIATTVAFVASDDAAFMTGSVVTVDGGITV
jgi:NAD(P)-dependent dehydrogenase (short-subunit alcohol dehydrogenase family)